MTSRPSLSTYWKCQLIFWSLAALQWAVAGYTGPGFSWRVAVLHFLLDLVIYIVPSHLFRNFSRSRHWHQLSVGRLLPRLLPAWLLLAAIFMLVTIAKNYWMRVWFMPGFDDSFEQAFREQAFTIYITGLRLMAIWLLAYYAYHYSQRELEAVKKAGRLELLAREAEFNQLSAQLHPHFFFNSLNSIKALVVENPSEARRAVDRLSDILRSSLYEQQQVVTLAEEMALVQDYLELEKIRFEERLEIRWQIDETLMEQKILRLGLQTLVENAIKHGIAAQPTRGLIRVVVSRLENQQYWQVKVENTGTLPSDVKKGIGLRSLDERLQLLYPQRASFCLEKIQAGPVIATLKMPLE